MRDQDWKIEQYVQMSFTFFFSDEWNQVNLIDKSGFVVTEQLITGQSNLTGPGIDMEV